MVTFTDMMRATYFATMSIAQTQISISAVEKRASATHSIALQATSMCQALIFLVGAISASMKIETCVAELWPLVILTRLRKALS
jgi:hypothetical protein